LHTDLNPMVVKLYRIKKTLKKREKIGKWMVKIYHMTNMREKNWRGSILRQWYVIAEGWTLISCDTLLNFKIL
jgi:hypothetical protein